MYYILTYDIAEPKRLPKILKTCRRFLTWVQKSVFEGELTVKQFEQLEFCINEIIDHEEDSVIVYAIRTPQVFKKQIIGMDKNEITNFF